MIDFRYHVVSIVAVFLALALGLFIGATTLRGTVRGDITNRTDQVAHTNGVLRGQIGDLKTQLRNGQSFDTALQPYALEGRLAGESVVVISTPGTDGGMRTNVMNALTTAGATIAADVRLQNQLFDSQQDEFLGSLANRVAIPGIPLPNASGSARALALLADALVTSPRVKAVPRAAATRILAAYEAGGLLTTSGDTTQPGSLALLLAADGPPPDATPSPATDQTSLLTTFANDLDARSVGTVVAGPQSSDNRGGLVDAIRADKSLRANLSTVDDADLASGVITTVLALVEQAGGRSGSYGVGPGHDAPLPNPSPT